MIDSIKNIKISGEISAYIDGKLVFRDHNAIGSNYPGQLVSLLVPSSINPALVRPINTIKAYGDFTAVAKTITGFAWGTSGTPGNIEGYADMTAVFEPGDFDGTVSELRIYSSLNGESDYLAIRTGLTILKSSTNYLSITWKIKII